VATFRKRLYDLRSTVWAGLIREIDDMTWLFFRTRDRLRTFLPVILVAVVMMGSSSVLNGRAVAATNNKQWTAPVRIDARQSSSNQTGYSVSCPVVDFCLAANGNGSVAFLRHGRWSSPQSLEAGGSLDAVSCPTVTFCVVVSGAGQAVIFNGHSWSPTEKVGPEGAYHVSCPTTSFCAAVGASGLPGKPSTIATFDGHSWSWHQTSTTGTTNDRLMDVSCATSRFCVAVNLDGQILTFTGMRWLPSPTRGPKGLISVSCVTQTNCMALADSGAFLMLREKGWSTPRVIPGFRDSFAYSVACASTKECAAIGLSGQAAVWSAGRWSKPIVVFPGGFMAGVQVACTKSGACVAVNDRGSSASY